MPTMNTKEGLERKEKAVKMTRNLGIFRECANVETTSRVASSPEEATYISEYRPLEPFILESLCYTNTGH